MATKVMDSQNVMVLNRYSDTVISKKAFVAFETKDKTRWHMRISRGLLSLLYPDRFPFIEFIRIGDEWFLRSTHLRRGYKISYLGKDGKISGKRAIQVLAASEGDSIFGGKFKVEKTNLEYSGTALFKIDFSKRIPLNKKPQRS